MDFNDASVSLNLTEMSQSVSLSLISDDIAEDSEGFVVMLEVVSSNPLIQFNRKVAVIQINDDDGITFASCVVTSVLLFIEFYVTFAQSTYTVSEDIGSFIISIIPLPGNSSELTSIDINYQAIPSTTGKQQFYVLYKLPFISHCYYYLLYIVDDVTFSPPPGQLSFSNQLQNAVINVSIAQDDNLENNEAITLSLSSSNIQLSLFTSTSIRLLDTNSKLL